MSKIRQALQLLADSGLSMRQVAAALEVSKSTVSEIAMYARDAGVDWPLASTLSDDELQARLYPTPRPRGSKRTEPDYAALHQELKRPGVTLQLLWEEYRAGTGEQAYRYSAFCDKYRTWAKRLKRSMRQVHPGGERLFVDYAGQTVPVVDAASGEIRRAQVFVAVLGASNYTYACATWQQTACDWVGAIIAAFAFIGGVPRLVVPDQPRALIANPDAYEPVTARLMQELGEHYGVAVLPARPGRPQDKAKVEVGVQVVERWILARLRHRRFFSLGETQPCHRPVAGRVEPASVQAAARLPAQRLRGAGRAGAEATAGPADGAGAVRARARDHRLPRRLRGPLLLGAAPARRRGVPNHWKALRAALMSPFPRILPSRIITMPRTFFGGTVRRLAIQAGVPRSERRTLTVAPERPGGLTGIGIDPDTRP